MASIYHLATCSTCQRIIKHIDPDGRCNLQDIKAEPLTAQQLDDLRQITGSYESLFSRRALKFRAMGLHQQVLDEDDYRSLILSEYTFLKRPVVVTGGKAWVGNSKSLVEAAKAALISNGYQ